MTAIQLLIDQLRQTHHTCDGDTSYSCPKSPEGCADDNAGTECNCGADDHNKTVDALAIEVGELTDCLKEAMMWVHASEVTNDKRARLIKRFKKLLK